MFKLSAKSQHTKESNKFFSGFEFHCKSEGKGMHRIVTVLKSRVMNVLLLAQNCIKIIAINFLKNCLWLISISITLIYYFVLHQKYFSQSKSDPVALKAAPLA